MVEKQFLFLVIYKRNTIRDGGSTALYAAYTVYTVDIIGTVTLLHCLHLDYVWTHYIPTTLTYSAATGEMMSCTQVKIKLREVEM